MTKKELKKKREEFAAVALAALIAKRPLVNSHEFETDEDFVEHLKVATRGAVYYADAMLEELGYLK